MQLSKWSTLIDLPGVPLRRGVLQSRGKHIPNRFDGNNRRSEL